MASLENPALKVIRAKEHIDTLDAELRMFYSSKPFAVVMEEDPQSKRKAIRVRITPPPLRLGIIAGEAVAALRSALDQLAWQLALTNRDSGTPTEDTAFPMFAKYDRDTERRFIRITKELPPAAAYEIQAFQPFQQGRDYQLDPLWRINRMCNVDKHQVIPVESSSVEFASTVTAADIEEVRRVPEREMLFVLTVAGSAKVKLKPEATAGVTFGSKRHGLVLNIGEIRGLHHYVAETVLPRFQRFF